MHGIFTPDNEKMFRRFAWQPYISISEAQEPRLGLNYIHTVYNGIDTAIFVPAHTRTTSLPSSCRFSPEKDLYRQLKLLVLATTFKNGWQIDADRDFIEQLESQIDGEQIQYLGEVSHEQSRVAKRSHCYPVPNHVARAFWSSDDRIDGNRYTRDWDGTGPVPEIIAHGKTGFVCHSLEKND